MRAIRGADDDESRDAVREAFAEGQRHHAAIRSTGDGAKAGDAEMVDEPQQQFGLVVGGHGREWRAITRAGGVGARAQIVETQDAKRLCIEREARPHDFVPPAAARLIGQPDAARCGDAADRHHHRSAGRTCQTPGDRNRFERAAEMQLELAGNREHAFAHLHAVDCGTRGIVACSSFVLSLLIECSNPSSTQRGTRRAAMRNCTAPRSPGPGGEEAAHLPEPAFC